MSIADRLRTNIAGSPETPSTLRERAALFLRLAAQAGDAVGEQELSRLARLYLEDALELEAASGDGDQTAHAERAAEGM